MEEGATKCDPDDDQIFETGTWDMNEGETTLTITPTGDDPPTVFTIVSMSSSQVVMTETEDLEGTTYTYTYTFTAL